MDADNYRREGFSVGYVYLDAAAGLAFEFAEGRAEICGAKSDAGEVKSI